MSDNLEYLANGHETMSQQYGKMLKKLLQSSDNITTM